MTTYRHRGLGLSWAWMSVLVWLAPTAGHARPFTNFGLIVVRLELGVGPPTQQVPNRVRSTVATTLAATQVSIPLRSLQKLLPQNLTVSW